jgi:hypothetical protein
MKKIFVHTEDNNTQEMLSLEDLMGFLSGVGDIWENPNTRKPVVVETIIYGEWNDDGELIEEKQFISATVMPSSFGK